MRARTRSLYTFVVYMSGFAPHPVCACTRTHARRPPSALCMFLTNHDAFSRCAQERDGKQTANAANTVAVAVIIIRPYTQVPHNDSSRRRSVSPFWIGWWWPERADAQLSRVGRTRTHARTHARTHTRTHGVRFVCGPVNTSSSGIGPYSCTYHRRRRQRRRLLCGHSVKNVLRLRVARM